MKYVLEWSKIVSKDGRKIVLQNVNGVEIYENLHSSDLNIVT